MNELYVAARTVHYASAMLLFGGVLFGFVLAGRAWSAARGAAAPARHGGRWMLMIAGYSAIAVSLASGAVWLVIQSALMTGAQPGRVPGLNALGLVLTKTLFGRVWILRCGLAVALCALLPAISASDKRRRYFAIAATVVSGAYLATLAWAGHAAAGEGLDRLVQIVSDIVHLLAAGAWLGALPVLVYMLRRAPSHSAAAQATQRFSIMGVASVVAIVATGLANTWYLVGTVPALIGTEYGRLVLLKVALLAAMLALAATNRWRLTPRMINQESQALRALVRNAFLETVLGIAIVAVVGLLGITVPAAHKAPVWPFDHTLSLDFAHGTPGVRAAAIVTGACLVVCAIVVLAGAWARRRRVWMFGVAGTAAAAALGWGVLLVPAYPTTYVASPVRYNVDAIARGSALYAQSCTTCHGRGGHGDGPAAATLSVKPADLIEHVAHHRVGDLYWLIAHGNPQATMPAFSPAISDAQVWDLIQFLRTQSGADEAVSMDASVEPRRTVVAPDFTFEFASHGQESLRDQRGRFVTLVVLYSLPQSVPRLRELASQHHLLAHAQLRVLALPMNGTPKPIDLEGISEDEWIFPLASPNVAAAYRMFTRSEADAEGAVPMHAEFLIDRQGFLRARWTGLTDPEGKRMAELRGQLDAMSREREGPMATDRHGGH